VSAQNWTAADVPDQAGKIAVVTGANSGIGLVTARELARAGARTVLACRDTAKGEAAAEGIRGQVEKADVEVLRLDLADLTSVRAFAEAVAARHDGIDLLVNNAGVMALPHRKTADGFEMQLGTNHLGHFALTGLLLPQLRRRPQPRVVTVASGAHRFGRINFDDLQSERRYRKWPAYGQSKLANLLFAYELQRRAEAAGLPLRSMAAHPGYADTNLPVPGTQMTGSRVRHAVMSLGARLFAQDAEMGALPSLYAATVADLPGGSYVGAGDRFELRGYPRVVGASAAARDRDVAGRLWQVSEELTGVHFDFAATPAH
jgi:NAD(P)-dependent dehydrogenase (short-subunit alcohol dehydrogenase family)